MARSLRRLRFAALLLVVACIAALPSTASAAPSHVLKADIRIDRFAVNHSGMTALGTESAQLSGDAARQRVRFAVSKGGSCNVLTLNLQQLNLQLLGLNLVTSAINLKITGRSSESLGALFCRLSRGLKLGRAAAAAASLNHHLRHHPLHAVRVRARLPVMTAQASQASGTVPACKVLDLVLGPLNLDLLGLVVDLYGPTKSQPVEVHVTADPAGGVLGSVFCKLANGQAAG